MLSGPPFPRSNQAPAYLSQSLTGLRLMQSPQPGFQHSGASCWAALALHRPRAVGPLLPCLLVPRPRLQRHLHLTLTHTPHSLPVPLGPLTAARVSILYPRWSYCAVLGFRHLRPGEIRCKSVKFLQILKFHEKTRKREFGARIEIAIYPKRARPGSLLQTNQFAIQGKLFLIMKTTELCQTRKTPTSGQLG